MDTTPNSPRPPVDALGLSLSLPMSRRDALRVGLFSTAGFLCSGGGVWGATPEAPAAEAGAAGPVRAKAKSVIQIFLWGGMSHNDTWDPKPDTGRDYMGDFKTAIATNADGIRIGELFPNLAKQADKYAGPVQLPLET